MTVPPSISHRSRSSWRIAAIDWKKEWEASSKADMPVVTSALPNWKRTSSVTRRSSASTSPLSMAAGISPTTRVAVVSTLVVMATPLSGARQRRRDQDDRHGSRRWARNVQLPTGDHRDSGARHWSHQSIEPSLRRYFIDILLTCRYECRKPESGARRGVGDHESGSGSEGDDRAVSMHGLTSITLGVPDVDTVASYYEDFGLRRVGDRPGRGLVFATVDGGEQLVLRPTERRRLLELGIGADDPDDLDRVEAGLRRLGVEFERDAGSLRVRDPNSALQVSVQVSPRITEAAAKQEPTNGPGRPDRPNGRAPAIERAGRVQPRRLGHVVIGSLDQEASQRFFTHALGFKVSDRVPRLPPFSPPPPHPHPPPPPHPPRTFPPPP